MAFIKKHSRLLFFLTLPVYFFIVQQSIQYKHTHFYPNGMVVTHSDPYDNSEEEPISQLLRGQDFFQSEWKSVMLELNVELRSDHCNIIEDIANGDDVSDNVLSPGE